MKTKKTSNIYFVCTNIFIVIKIKHIIKLKRVVDIVLNVEKCIDVQVVKFS